MSERAANAVAKPVRRTQRQRREQTEHLVLEAAKRIILDHGVRSVTVARVGEAAGYSRGIVNHTFGTRDALILALVERLQSRVVISVDDRKRLWIGPTIAVDRRLPGGLRAPQ